MATKYRYRLKSTQSSSHKYGDCEVCGKHVSEVFHQTEEKAYKRFDNPVEEGWTGYQCAPTRFGHEHCLYTQQRTGEIISKTTDRYGRAITIIIH